MGVSVHRQRTLVIGLGTDGWSCPEPGPLLRTAFQTPDQLPPPRSGGIHDPPVCTVSENTFRGGLTASSVVRAGEPSGGSSSQQPIVLSSLMCHFNLAIIVGVSFGGLLRFSTIFHALATSSLVLGYFGFGTLAAFIPAKNCGVWSLEAFSNSSGVKS